MTYEEEKEWEDKLEEEALMEPSKDDLEYREYVGNWV
jgi:hypothetical protein